MTGISSPTEAMGGMGGGKSRRKLSKRGGGAKRSLYRSGLHGRTQKTKESNIYNPLTGSGGGNRQGRQEKQFYIPRSKEGGERKTKKKERKKPLKQGALQKDSGGWSGGLYIHLHQAHLTSHRSRPWRRVQHLPKYLPLPCRHDEGVVSLFSGRWVQAGRLIPVK